MQRSLNALSPSQKIKGQQLLSFLAKSQEEQEYTISRSKEKTGKFLSNFNGYMGGCMGKNTKSLSHRVSLHHQPICTTSQLFPINPYQKDSKNTPKAGGRAGEFISNCSGGSETFPRLREGSEHAN